MCYMWKTRKRSFDMNHENREIWIEGFRIRRFGTILMTQKWRKSTIVFEFSLREIVNVDYEISIIWSSQELRRSSPTATDPNNECGTWFSESITHVVYVTGTGQRDVAIYLFEYTRQNNVARSHSITSKSQNGKINKFTSTVRKSNKIFIRTVFKKTWGITRKMANDNLNYYNNYYGKCHYRSSAAAAKTAVHWSWRHDVRWTASRAPPVVAAAYLSFFRIAPFDTRRPAPYRSASTQLAVLFFVHFSQSTFTTFITTSRWPKPKRRKTRMVSWRISWPVVSPLPCRRPPLPRSSASSLSCKCRPLPRRSPLTNSTKVRISYDIFKKRLRVLFQNDH